MMIELTMTASWLSSIIWLSLTIFSHVLQRRTKGLHVKENHRSRQSLSSKQVPSVTSHQKLSSGRVSAGSSHSIASSRREMDDIFLNNLVGKRKSIYLKIFFPRISIFLSVKSIWMIQKSNLFRIKIWEIKNNQWYSKVTSTYEELFTSIWDRNFVNFSKSCEQTWLHAIERPNLLRNHKKNFSLKVLTALFAEYSYSKIKNEGKVPKEIVFHWLYSKRQENH